MDVVALKNGRMGSWAMVHLGGFRETPDGMGSSQIDSKAVVCPVDMMGVGVLVDMNERAHGTETGRGQPF